jgi:HlyD family secretion protein
MGELGAAWRAGRRRWAWLVAAVVVAALAAYGVVHAVPAGTSEKPSPPVTVAADTGAVTTQVAATGTLQPAQTRSLSFAVDGTVESVSVTPGTSVTPGQVLAKVDSTDAAAAVNSARDALNQAQDALTAARDNAAKAAATPAATCTGANVPAAYPQPSVSVSPTATPSTRPTATATATATVPGRTRNPTPSTTHTAVPGGRPSCSAGSRSGGSQSGAQNGGTDAVYSAQQAVNQATLTLANAQQALDGATITAPIAGKILAVNGKVGSQVSAGSAFVTLADAYDMQISAEFPEADADRLAVGRPATATLADRPGDTFKATVVQVDPVGTSDGTMVRYGVLLSFVDPPKDLLVGQSANVVVTTGSVADTLRVPNTAVHDVAGTTGTVLKAAGGATTQAKVGVGLIGDQYTQITSGLAPGDVVARSW